MGVFALLKFLSLCGLSSCVEIAVESPVFDIQNVNHRGVFLEEGTIFDVPFKSFITKSNYSFKRLVDGGVKLWEAKADEELTTVNLFSKGKTTLISLVTRAFSIYFHEKNGKEWRQINEKEFDSRLVSMNDSFKSINRTYQLELGGVSGDDSVLPSSWTTKGVTYQCFSLKNDLSIEKVIDDGQEVWRSKKGAKCVFALICSSYGRSVCRINIVGAKNTDTIHSKRFYKGIDGRWNEVSEDEYDKRLYGILYSHLDGIKVDILSPSDGTFDNLVYNDYGVETRLVSPINGFKITSLYDGPNIIWKAKGSSSLVSATFFKRRDMHVGSLVVDGKEMYVASLDGVWGRITEKTFSKQLSKIINVVKPPKSALPSRTLDVSDVHALPFFNYFANGVPMRKYIASNDERIGRVMDGALPIWKSDSYKCLLCEMYSRRTSRLIVLYVTSGKKGMFRYFEKVNSVWTSINKLEFAKKLLDMSKSVYYSLDIANPDESKVTVYGRSNDELRCENYSVNAGVLVDVVTDGSDVVWKAQVPYETCEATFHCRKEGKHSLLVLALANPFSIHKFFELVNGEWIPITQKDFEIKRKDMYSEML